MSVESTKAKDELRRIFDEQSAMIAQLTKMCTEQLNEIDRLQGLIYRVSRVTYAGEAHSISDEDENMMDEIAMMWLNRNPDDSEKVH